MLRKQVAVLSLQVLALGTLEVKARDYTQPGVTAFKFSWVPVLGSVLSPVSREVYYFADVCSGIAA